MAGAPNFDFKMVDSRCFAMAHANGNVTVALHFTTPHVTSLTMSAADARDMAAALTQVAEAAEKIAPTEKAVA